MGGLDPIIFRTTSSWESENFEYRPTMNLKKKHVFEGSKRSNIGSRGQAYIVHLPTWKPYNHLNVGIKWYKYISPMEIMGSIFPFFFQSICHRTFSCYRIQFHSSRVRKVFGRGLAPLQACGWANNHPTEEENIFQISSMLIFGGVFVTGSSWVGHDPRDSVVTFTEVELSLLGSVIRQWSQICSQVALGKKTENSTFLGRCTSTKKKCAWFQHQLMCVFQNPSCSNNIHVWNFTETVHLVARASDARPQYCAKAPAELKMSALEKKKDRTWQGSFLDTNPKDAQTYNP